MRAAKWYRMIGLVMMLTIVAGSFSAMRAQGREQKRGDIEFTIPPEGKIQILRTEDGSELIGRIVRIGKHNILFESDLGRTEIRKSKVRSLVTVDRTKLKDGKLWFDNPNATRLFFAPTARMLKQGKGYFSDIYLFFPSVAYGLTDNVTIGGGISLFPGVPMSEQLLYFTPKVGFSIGASAHGAVGVLLLRTPDFDVDGADPLGLGILYGTTTFGSLDRSMTFGLGYGFVNDQVAEKPMMILGGEMRISQRISLVTENWVMPGIEGAIISYGLRFFGRKLAVDLAFWSSSNDFLFPGIPYVDFVYTF